VFDFLKEYVGDESASAVQHLVLSSSHLAFNSWSSLVTSAIFVYAALSLFRQLKTGLNIVWKLPPMPRHGVVGFVYDLLLATILVLFTGLFVVFLTSASMANAFLSDLPAIRGVGRAAWRWIDFGVVLVLQALILTLTYRFLSEGRIKYRHIFGGAWAAAVLLTLGKSAFTIYLHLSRLDTVYGAAGSMVVFLVWVYYSAQIVFFGAEVIKATMMGSTSQAQRA
jgi:membrane protein